MKTFIILTIIVFFFAVLSTFALPKEWLTEVKFLIGMFLGQIVYTGIKDATKEEK